MAYKTAQVKALALADKPEGTFVELTRANVGSRSYPLTRTAYIYFAPDRPTGDPVKVDPKIKEFLRYVLSRQGQADVEREGDYLPLSADLVREQLKKLE
jgi:phosphate transport system substrate-binding protein